MVILGKGIQFHARYATRDATQFRNAGPLTPRHKCTVYAMMIRLLSYLRSTQGVGFI